LRSVKSECVDCGNPCWGEQCRKCYISKHRVPESTCLKCGKAFSRYRQYNYSKNEPKYCSRECSFKALADGERTTGLQRVVLPELTKDLVGWFNGWEIERKVAGRAIKAHQANTCKCQKCKKEMPAIRKRHGFIYRKYCSEECRSKRLPKLMDLQCKTCGKTIRRWTKCGHATCKPCKKRALAKQRKLHRNRRKGSERFRSRCRKFGGYFNPTCKAEGIYKRDNYRCHMCGRQCVIDKINWNRPNCATVDHHPVPLSKGGDHDWHNVRTCCRRCNTKKGNAWSGQKLFSFGPAVAPNGGG